MKAKPILKKVMGTLILVLITTLSYGQQYYAYVAAESDDAVYLIKYDAATQQGSVVDEVKVGMWPTENEGPHGLNVGLDGEYWYLSIAHGNPYGWLYKYETGTNKMVSKTELGMFPASMEISKATGLLYVVNFNLHGDMEPSTVSVVDPESMQVVTDIKTGIMPHGSRITDDGRWQYHVSMMTDELMQINTASLKLSKRFPLSDVATNAMSMSSSGGGMQSHHHQMPAPQCKPTWVDPHPSKNLVYVACNGSDVIKEIDTNNWSVSRTFNTGKGTAPYNLEVSANAKWLVASYKGTGETGVWNLDSGKEAANIANSRKVTHGVSITPDSRLAFISVEGIGGEPGSVDIIDLEQLARTSVVEVGKQAGGIIFWKSESEEQ